MNSENGRETSVIITGTYNVHVPVTVYSIVYCSVQLEVTLVTYTVRFSRAMYIYIQELSVV